jgi:23S rRNA U2552 (ribose-2'-O)-methylase RlmE/FtsJ
MDSVTRAFDTVEAKGNPSVLDMCMAPGGYIAAVLDQYPDAKVRGFTLPVEKGGHAMKLQSANIHLQSLDVTLLAGDMGLVKADVPSTHPGASDFMMQNQIQETEKFDLIFCDGQVLRTHVRAEWREHGEALRLRLTQLAIGLEHVTLGGTMIILLHKLEEWENLQLLHILNKFAEVQLFKSTKSHALRSSFYAVAKNIRALSVEAIEAIATWKGDWRVATFGTDADCKETFAGSWDDAETLLGSFGEKFVSLGRNVWRIQGNALKGAKFVKNAGKNQIK